MQDQQDHSDGRPPSATIGQSQPLPQLQLQRSDSFEELSPSATRTKSSTDEGHPRKKRKVNHACIYCRRSHMTCDSERPCSRCIKRNIGHLCHDEPRETPHRKSTKSDSDSTVQAHEAALPEQTSPNRSRTSAASTLDNGLLSASTTDLKQSPVGDASVSQHTSIGQPFALADVAAANVSPNTQHNRLHDLSSFHPNHMFNANEVSNEYNLFNDFLSTSLFDESGILPTEDMTAYNDPSFMNFMNVGMTGTSSDLLPATQVSQTLNTTQLNFVAQGHVISRPGSTKPTSDKAREKYYMTAADPSGTDSPEERMNKLLKAKYDAGLLKPFNYVNGYARLNRYMEKNMKSQSRHKILMQLDRFRPKFRERMQSLTDIELVLVEMWFEKSLMEYDRIFASMAIPACCWRRTGEIFRGNREMAELIGVPIESLRDGKLAIHDFIVEDQLVSYWEKFCAICFDQQQKAMLTSCTLRPTTGAERAEIQCCFSFTIRRDDHNIPSLIVGNFLPVNPPRHRR